MRFSPDFCASRLAQFVARDAGLRAELPNRGTQTLKTGDGEPRTGDRTPREPESPGTQRPTVPFVSSSIAESSGGVYSPLAFLNFAAVSHPCVVSAGAPARNQIAIRVSKIIQPNEDVCMKGQIGFPHRW